jgi:hypothetical protein
VRALARREPELAVTGHGPAMRGAEMRAALHQLARDFDRIAVQEQGRYVDEPARAEDGSAYRWNWELRLASGANCRTGYLGSGSARSGRGAILAKYDRGDQ